MPRVKSQVEFLHALKTSDKQAGNNQKSKGPSNLDRDQHAAQTLVRAGCGTSAFVQHFSQVGG